ncbi:nicotinate-nucleotide adenylyltransferase [Clostridium celatum]|uniref:Probable nicotinate-nucleotide adenylyltransferase n=1 Tax=Clostridium celatum DSM 1785 TaxID=545697 RepID=L1Q3S4_9CLOT|nr:nicotinate-nucleotide adenylyltransferase [Clostridium celatum]EKY22257.1 nicotinate-nucleotide adenylyltransferase [Clostridium celatum DSM 1785]MCE9654620.1 nicotinate-nucleotide adenylyltransferase [Clostridium celatum]MDU3723111.1 nicotinate-nucleotide adenylyltransferase [Clostridium celatum]
MKKYGIMGGTFNPIHLAHLYIAYEAKEQLNLDKVIFIPAGNPPHKKNNGIIDAEYRYNMVKKAIDGYEDFIISDYEVNKNGYSYTYETLKYLKNKYYDTEIFFISGGDSLMDIEKWREPEQVLKNCTFVAFNRGVYTKEILSEQKKKLEDKYKCKITLLDVVDIDISSSIIRKRIQDGKRVDFFLSKEVKDYIEENALYKGE